ncbi:MAG TPA: sulfotransferase [Nevskiaceae bacterium]|nr:sulfotransferase [Nevskiaceae bacterium]
MSWPGPQNRLNLSRDAWQSLKRVYADQLGDVPWKLKASYGFLSRYLSLLERRESPALKAPPVFIVGHWRSGTTFLHELLVCDPQFAYPSTYACMNPQHFVMTERGAEKLSGNVEATRPMDAMKISSASPQEDEFALLCLGARSPYEGVLFPQRLRRALQSGAFEALSPAEQETWKRLMVRFAGQVGSKAPDRTLLLKSPPHGWRVSVLRELFAGARFVHIVRDPFDVAASTRRMWQQLYGIYALTPPPYPDPLPDIAPFQAQLLAATDRAMDGAKDSCTVRFEDLMSAPHRELERIYATLELGDYAAVRPRFEAQLAKNAGHQKNVLKLSDDDRALIRRCSSATIEKYRYSS